MSTAGRTLCGADRRRKLVLPGAGMDASSIYDLLETERVTVTAGVPTIWIALMRHIEDGNLPLTSLKRILVGGSAMPEPLIAKFDHKFGIEVRQAWGMTRNRGDCDDDLPEFSPGRNACNCAALRHGQTGQVGVRR